MHRPLVVVILLVGCLALSGCGSIRDPANPTPQPFDVLLQVLQQNGIRVTGAVSGDPGCDDQALARTAVSFMAEGFDQANPTKLYLYGFRNRATWERLLPEVDTCARAYATDPATFASIQVSPFVVNGAGPWGAQFTDRLRETLTRAAGNGG